METNTDLCENCDLTRKLHSEGKGCVQPDYRPNPYVAKPESLAELPASPYFCWWCKAEVVQRGDATWEHVDAIALKRFVNGGAPHNGSPFPPTAQLASRATGLPERPKAYDGWSGDSWAYAVNEVDAHFDKLEAMLAQKDVELKEAYAAEASGSSRLGDRYDAYFKTADPKRLMTFSGWLNKRIGDAEDAEQALEGAREKAGQDGIRKALKAVLDQKVASDGSAEWLGHNNALDGTITAILALLPSSPAQD